MAHAFLDELLSDTRPVVEALLREEPIALSDLRASIDTFETELPSADQHPLVDDATALRLSRGCRALLDAVAADPERLRLAQVAVRYLVMDEDADSDTESPFGFDDDVEVFNAVCEELGLPELVLVGYD